MASNSFTEQLPLELRREVYALVLRARCYIKPATRELRSHGIDTALFTVSKIISDESRAIFFDINTVIVDATTFTGVIKSHNEQLRHLYFSNHLCGYTNPVTKFKFATKILLLVPHTLSRLRTVTMQCDGLDCTVRRMLQSHNFWNEARHLEHQQLRCIEVGLYEWSVPSSRLVWRFEYKFLRELWAAVSSSEDGFRSRPWMIAAARSRCPVREGSKACEYWIQQVNLPHRQQNFLLPAQRGP